MKPQIQTLESFAYKNYWFLHWWDTSSSQANSQHKLIHILAEWYGITQIVSDHSDILTRQTDSSFITHEENF